MKPRSVDLELGGRQYTLRLNLNTMAAFEEATGRDGSEFGDYLQELTDGPKFGKFRDAFTFLMADNEPPPSVREVGRLLHMENFPYAAAKFVELVTGKAAADRDPRELAPFVPTPQGAVEVMLDMAGLRVGETLVDLGAGDGRILEAALRRGALSAIGYEIDDERFKALVARELDVRQVDVMDAEISDADVVTLYLLPSSNAKLREKFERECKPGARIVSYDFNMPVWIPSEERTFTDGKKVKVIYCWQRPGAAVVMEEAEAVSV